MPRPVSVALGGAGVAAIGYFALAGRGLKTPGMRNIENRHAAAGGGHDHTPAQASKLGDESHTDGYQETQKGVNSKYFQDNFASQKPEASAPGKAWNKALTGTESGKGSSVR